MKESILPALGCELDNKNRELEQDIDERKRIEEAIMLIDTVVQQQMVRDLIRKSQAV